VLPAIVTRKSSLVIIDKRQLISLLKKLCRCGELKFRVKEN
jgi:hypothetical protein